MAAFKNLRQSRALLEEAMGLRDLGDLAGAWEQLQLAVKASEGAVEARVALAQILWDCAESQEEMDKVQALLQEAVMIAKDSMSEGEAAHEAKAACKLALLHFQSGKEAEGKALI